MSANLLLSRRMIEITKNVWKQPDNCIRRIKLELLKAGHDLQNLRIDLQPSVIVVVKPVQFLEGEIWNRLMVFLRGLGFRWFKDERAWKRGMIES